MSEIKKELYEDRTQYTLNKNLHREDGPAIEWNDGVKEWFRNGKRHREDGPAIEWTHGINSWWRNGKRHREDGPAVVSSDGHKSWYLNNKKVDFWAVWNLNDDKERKKKLCFYLEEISK